MKQRSCSQTLADENYKVELQEEANYRMDCIRKEQANVDCLTAEYNSKLAALTDEYDAQINPHHIKFLAHQGELLKLMKKGKAYLFDGTDVVRLKNGSLIHSVTDKVSIPRDALARCEELGLGEVIKIAKSLDRDAVEKWPDAKLILIGAERKTKEEYSYDLAEVKP